MRVFSASSIGSALDTADSSTVVLFNLLSLSAMLLKICEVKRIPKTSISEKFLTEMLKRTELFGLSKTC